ncbi:MAG: LysR family transcriptional regulator, transcriptional activator for dmlA [Paraburkholderia sp.]|jgi:DNA-binding transcriptional LysR family regulator|uniref:LysR family transcriptional regulator n=1 Tax=Paraburkholderia sp. TaxID=1926495 RepID=UPI002AFFF60E|nr:LysR family transcriptional regulator [Paraburkholderia sp.]MEA3084026.1 LysR family transcriptional regulator, transcriptional activator for dmlA [Paraburkholderia sp.]
MDAVSDLEFFVALVKHGSLSALARDVGVTPPAVSARLAQIERRLGVRLLNRTTRRLSMTHEGEQYLTTGSKLLSALQELDRTISSSRATPKGLLRVNATFGFGRRHIAPAIAAFHRQYPDVEVQLELTDRPLNLAEAAFDVGVRFGEIPDSRLIARKVATNRRMICASPIYLRAKGEPDTPRDLQRHQCIVLRENDTAYGTWHFSKGKRHETVKVHGVLSSNDGEATLVWALDGQGILMRSEWDATTYLQSGRLKQLLPDWSLPPADIYAVYPERLNLTAKVTAFIEFLEGFLGKGPGAG